ncbi:MAG: glucokinase [Candidatus Thiodiazotropha sp.]
MHILAGDIGGTNTRLAWFDTETHGLQPRLERTYPSPDHDSIEAILEKFLALPEIPEIELACLGVAGPVIDQVCETTNLPWRLDAAAIRQQFRFRNTWLLNDLEANAWGLETLEAKDLHTLHEGRAQTGNRSIVSAGTGLGQAGIYWDGKSYVPFSSEGGHADFSPTSPQEYALFEYLSARYGHVSWERLVSGPGIENIYEFLLMQHGLTTPDALQQRMQEIGRAPAISEAALKDDNRLCSQTLGVFVRLYARETANHALKIMARGGVFLGGGIAPKILPLFEKHDFVAQFQAKGRMSPLLASMPLRVVLNDKTALLGAAYYAAHHV